MYIAILPMSRTNQNTAALNQNTVGLDQNTVKFIRFIGFIIYLQS